MYVLMSNLRAWQVLPMDCHDSCRRGTVRRLRSVHAAKFFTAAASAAPDVEEAAPNTEGTPGDLAAEQRVDLAMNELLEEVSCAELLPHCMHEPPTANQLQL